VRFTPILPRNRLATRLILALIALATTASGQTPDAARQIPEGLNVANGLYRLRRYDLAIEEYEKFLQSNQPRTEADVGDAWFGLGNARLFLGKYKDARQAFEEFVKVTPDHPFAPTGRYRVGESAYVLGDLPAARQALELYVGTNAGDRRYLQAAWSYLGDIDFRLNDLPAARKAFESALLGNPQGSLANRARLGLGKLLAAQGETEPALRVLRDLAGRGGAEWSDKAWLEAAKIEAALGRWQDAVDALGALEKATPRSPLVAEARIERAEALGKLDRRDEAENLLRTVAEDPSQPLAAQAADALGASQLARGKPAEALATFDQASVRLAASPSVSTLRYHAAEALLAMGKPNEARSRFLKLAADDPKAPSADDAQLRAIAMTLDAKDAVTARKLAAPFASRFRESPLRADARLLDARAALALGQPKDAIQVLEASLNEDKPAPNVVQATYYYLGLAYQKDGQPAKASEVLAKLARTPTPVAADAQYLIGQTEFDAGRFEQAIPALEAYFHDKPKGEVADHALARIAQAQSELNRPDDADATLARLADGFPKSPTLPATRIRLAEAALAAKKYDRSAELFRQASESDDPAQKARARSGLGWSLLRNNQPVEAAEAFGALLDASPDDPLAPEAALARAYALGQAKQPEAAVAAYAFAVEKYPRSPQAGPAALALARLQNETRKPDEAAKAFALVVKDYASTSGEPLDSVLSEWGWTLIDAGKAAEADAAFGRLLKEFPDSPRAADARYNLAISAFASKDFDRVLDLLKPLVLEGSTARPQIARPALNLYGRTQAERLDWSGAAASFDRLIAEDTEGTYRREARFWKAEVAFKSGDAKLAEPEFAALASEPPLETDFKGLASTARARRIQCLAQLGRWEDTIAAADVFKTTDPADPFAPEVDYARGRASQGLARFDEAREAFDHVIAARRGSELAARAQLMRGESYFHQRQYKDALREYYRVIIQYNAPEWQAVALLEAGKVHEKLDQWKEAVESYEKLRTQFPKDRNVEEAGKRLEAARARIARPGGAEDARTR
jgi:cellulose synthase operon protein C